MDENKNNVNNGNESSEEDILFKVMIAIVIALLIILVFLNIWNTLYPERKININSGLNNVISNITNKTNYNGKNIPIQNNANKNVKPAVNNGQTEKINSLKTNINSLMSELDSITGQENSFVSEIQ